MFHWCSSLLPAPHSLGHPCPLLDFARRPLVLAMSFQDVSRNHTLKAMMVMVMVLVMVMVMVMMMMMMMMMMMPMPMPMPMPMLVVAVRRIQTPLLYL